MRNAANRNFSKLAALISRRHGAGTTEGNTTMSGASLRNRRIAVSARPDWLPHPTLMHFVAGLWLAAVALRLAQGPLF